MNKRFWEILKNTIMFFRNFMSERSWRPKHSNKILQCLYSVKLVVKIDFLNTELHSYHTMHHSISNMLCIAFSAIEHTWSALTVSSNTGRLRGAKPALVFALATHHLPLLKFFSCGECDEKMVHLTTSWLF